MTVAVVSLVAVVGFGFFRREAKPTPGANELALRSTSVVLVAVRDLARLETNELHYEKVIDLSDRQSHFFGLVEATDAILLVASGDVTIGVDLGQLTEADITTDPATKRVTVHLPQPDVLSTRLDEGRTYVYTRTTNLLARRNEQLETRARQEAVVAIEKAARETDVIERARRQAEKTLHSLASGLGVHDLVIAWKSPSGPKALSREAR
jgi:hypothetical protein